jgi:DUF2934 family protein
MKRAYVLWEQAGMPEGRAEEFYHQAEQELRNEDKSDPSRTTEQSMNKDCPICLGIGWVCENHSGTAFDFELGCICGEAMTRECNDSNPPDTSQVTIVRI